MNAPTLVVLAAGMGSRYGGVKQIDRVGKAGETLLDYSVFDALASGFSRIVFVVRRSIADDFKQVVLSRIEGKVDYALAYQELDSLIDPASAALASAAGRSKPWGTAHAVLCAREAIASPFAVINADDFYGREAFAAMAAFLAGPAARSGAEGAIVPYRLERTLSVAGSVSRGVCRVEGGYLLGVTENTAIEKRGGRVLSSGGGAEVELPADAPVSMNFWGFPLSALDGIDDYFRRFLAEKAAEPKSEAYLPSAVDDLVAGGKLRVRALEADSEWFGMTYREDREAAARRIAELSASGRYPSPLWGRA